ncbi:AraC family transcriptional regulator [Pontibacter sp. CAU 1760]
MPQEHLPVFKIQDFNAQAQQERYVYVSSFAAHLKEHLFIREPYKHNFYILLYITQGSGTHTIDFREYEVTADSVFVMMPGQVHSWELADDTDGFVMFFTPAFYVQAFPDRRPYDFSFFNALLQQPLLSVPPAANAGLLQTFQTLQVEYAAEDFKRHEMLGCYLGVLLIQLSRIYQVQAQHVAVPGGELSLLQRLEQLIEQHFREHLPVTFYAERLHVTAKQLKEICKRSLGKTTTQLIQERTVLEAQRLLVHSGLTSSQIAASLGYLDTSYFFRFFKKHTGSTPEQFRDSTHQAN